MRSKVLRWRGERARLGTWRGVDATAYLTPFPDGPALSSDFVERSVEVARAQGFRTVVTGALAPGESLGFIDAGFQLHEELHLLEHDLVTIPDAPLRTRKARKVDRPAVLALDARCFDDFWCLDEDGLEEAIDATPWSRFRVVVDPTEGRTLAGYAVTGRAGTRGYVQRLAVDPPFRRQGVGRTLVVDGLEWMKARGVRRALVNTHQTNEAALVLYESCGFRLLPSSLRIMTRTV